MEVFSERLGCSSHILMLVERISRNEDGTEKFIEIGRSVETGSLLGEDFYHPATREPSQVFDVSTRDPNFRFEVREKSFFSCFQVGFVKFSPKFL